MYLVDEFFFLLLVHLNKLRTLGESKVLYMVSGVKQGNRVGDESKISLLPQGFGSFPPVFSRARWRNLVRVECL